MKHFSFFLFFQICKTEKCKKSWKHSAGYPSVSISFKSGFWVFSYRLPSLEEDLAVACMISVYTFHAVTISEKTSTRRIHWPRGIGPKIPANQTFYSSSARIANQKNVAGYQAVPVTNACHMTLTPMETVTRLKICSWIWKEKRPSVPTFLLVQNAPDSLPETFQQEKCVFFATPEM